MDHSSVTPDAMLERLNTLEAMIVKQRQFLEVLETEQRQIRQHYENQIASEKTQMVVENQNKDNDVIMRDPSIEAWSPRKADVSVQYGEEIPIQRQKRELSEQEGERDNRTKRIKTEQEQTSSSRLLMKSKSKGSLSLIAGVPLSLGVFGGGSPLAGSVKGGNSLGLMPVLRSQRRRTKPAQAQTTGRAVILAHDKLPLRQQLLFQHSPRPPTLPSPFPEIVNLPSHPPELKREGQDWFALFNPVPKVKRVLDVNLVHTLIHESDVICVRFSQDGKWLATGCNRTAQIYDVETGVRTCILDHTSDDMYIRSVCFSPDAKYLATGAEDKQIRIWNVVEKQIHRILEGHQQGVRSLHFSSTGKFIVSGSCDRAVRIWNICDGTSKVLNIDDHYSLFTIDQGVMSVALSPDEKYVAVGDLHAAVSIWNVNTGLLVQRLRGHWDRVSCVAFMPNGKGLISGSLDNTLKYWDVSGLRIGSSLDAAFTNSTSSTRASGCPCLMNLTGHKRQVSSIAVSPDCRWVVSGTDEKVLFWDSRTGVVHCTLSGHQDPVFEVDFSPTGKFLVTASGDRKARIWSYGVVG